MKSHVFSLYSAPRVEAMYCRPPPTSIPECATPPPPRRPGELVVWAGLVLASLAVWYLLLGGLS